jgi:DNA topoisomerase I
LPRNKVLAAIVKILETGAVRVGNEEYARENNSFGLTTMQDRHACVSGSAIHFDFRGKGGKFHKVCLDDKHLARIVEHCQDLPGQDLFQYHDENGAVRDVTSTDVNQYLREITGGDFTAKDFRTWAGTVLAAMALREVKEFDTQAQAKKNITRAIERVAAQLGNTPAICKRCYVHPFVLNAYMDGSLLEQVVPQRAAKARKSALNPDEAMVARLLQRGLSRETRLKAPGGLLKQLQASVKHRKKAARCRSR